MFAIKALETETNRWAVFMGSVPVKHMAGSSNYHCFKVTMQHSYKYMRDDNDISIGKKYNTMVGAKRAVASIFKKMWKNEDPYFEKVVIERVA